MWSWGFISQDDLFTSQINSLVSVSISDVAEEKKEQIENKVHQMIKTYNADKVKVISLVNYIIVFMLVLCLFFLWVMFLSNSDLLIDKIIEDALIYMEYEELGISGFSD